MTTWYRVNTGSHSRISIVPVEVVKETAKTVVVDTGTWGDMRYLKESYDHTFFPNKLAAKAFSIPKAKARLQTAELELQWEKEALQEIVDL